MTTTKKQKKDAPAIGQRLLTLREYVGRGEIEGRIIGGRWRFRRAELDRFFAAAPRAWDFGGRNNRGD